MRKITFLDRNRVELSEDDLKHAQAIMTSMMKSIHDVCVKNNIKYWLGAGTLLGAVRHNGFIPWDDDFDISMLREDYDRFDRLAQKELGDAFFWQTYKTDKKWSSFQGKVRLKNTIWLESYFQHSLLKENGFFIDIFPIDNTFDNIVARKLHFFITKVFVLPGIAHLHKTKRFKSFLCRMMPCKIAMRIGNYLIRVRQKKHTKYVTSFSLSNTEKTLTLKSMLDDRILHPFENEFFYIPKEYDKILIAAYGDYMTPPPLKDREPHHNIVCLDFGKY